MSDLIRLVGGQPQNYSIELLHAANPLIQFPAEPSAQLLATYDIYTYTIAAEPTFNAVTERIEAGNVTSVGANFVRQWNTVTLTAEELAQRLTERREAMRVPRLAARLALLEAGLWDSIPTLLNAISDAGVKARALAYFEDAVTWQRLDSTVVMLGAGLSQSATDLDDLFDLAATKV